MSPVPRSRPSSLTRPHARSWTLAAIAVLAGCSDSPSAPGAGGGSASPQRVAAGRAAFVASCAGCHNSGDGLDLAHFGFPDSTIVRRALVHVSRPTALDIAAYVRSLGSAEGDRFERLFQPAGRVLATDVDFAVSLFGADEWPEDLTDAQLLAIDPREVPIALPLPRWSVEQSTFDWMPNGGLEDAMLDWDPDSPALESPRTYLKRYYELHDARDVTLALKALRDAATDPDNPGATCASQTEAREFLDCFEVHRWIAALAAQHVFREGPGWTIPREFHLTWWDVGQGLARGSFLDVPLTDDPRTAASWLYMSWMFAPGDARGQQYYPTRDIAEAGFPRLAVFHSLRAMVARDPGLRVAYADVDQAARHAPAHWAYAVTRFGFEHLLSRIDGGDWPKDLAYPRDHVNSALGFALQKVSDPGRRAELERLARELRDRLLARATGA